jgi:hypothetical protein
VDPDGFLKLLRQHVLQPLANEPLSLTERLSDEEDTSESQSLTESEDAYSSLSESEDEPNSKSIIAAPLSNINAGAVMASPDPKATNGTVNSPPKMFTTQLERCSVCMKVVYPMERLLADSNVYHKTCFRYVY